MRIIVNQELCEGNAECMKAAPAVFRVNQEDQVELLLAEPPEALRPAVELAVRRCPRRALALVD
jgi:ferredoxin